MISIPLIEGKIAYCDEEDYPLIQKYSWVPIFNGSNWKAYTKNGRGILMHRLIMDAKPGEIVDHRDRNGLNNCRSNLRKCTHSQNNCNRKSRNTTKLQGVSFVSQRGKWIARVYHLGKPHFGGYFKTELEAAYARDALAKKLHGDFAFLNFTYPMA